MPVKVAKPGVVARRKLYAYLMTALSGGPLKFSSADAKTLKIAIEGLEALDFGEIPPIFSPIRTTAKGRSPYRVKKSRAIALGFVDLLHANGWKKSDAREKVGDVFCVSPDALVKWSNQLRLPKNKGLRKFRTNIADRHEWDDKDIAKELYAAAHMHKLARK